MKRKIIFLLCFFFTSTVALAEGRPYDSVVKARQIYADFLEGHHNPYASEITEVFDHTIFDGTLAESTFGKTPEKASVLIIRKLNYSSIRMTMNRDMPLGKIKVTHIQSELVEKSPRLYQRRLSALLESGKLGCWPCFVTHLDCGNFGLSGEGQPYSYEDVQSGEQPATIELEMHPDTIFEIKLEECKDIILINHDVTDSDDGGDQ